MLISVVVPAYNEEKYIRPCLESVITQERHGFEVELIVVDGNSTDRTREIAREYGARVLVQQERGIAAARELGFRAARGELIASTDADSIPPRDWLIRMLSVLRRKPGTVGVYGPLRLYDGKWYEDLVTHYGGGTYLWLNSLIKRPGFSGQNFMVRREAWEEVGGFDLDWVSAEDVNLSLKLVNVGAVKFRWDIPVHTTRRRGQEGYFHVVRHTLHNYVRVTWLHKPPLPFKDIR